MLSAAYLFQSIILQAKLMLYMTLVLSCSDVLTIIFSYDLQFKELLLCVL